jgi:hypothetical protein
MNKPTVQHYLSVTPDEHVITRSRIVATEHTDEVSLFMMDRLVGVLSVPRGLGALLCQQMTLVERNNVISYEGIVREFERALSTVR